MTKQAKKSTSKHVKKTLQEFLQETSPKTSWADEMEHDEPLPASDSTMTDLRATIEAATTTTTTGPHRASRGTTTQQFEHGAEERSTAWIREQKKSPSVSTKREHRPLLEADMEEEGINESSASNHPRTGAVTNIPEISLPTEPPFVLFIKNLPYTTSREEVADFFESNGDIKIENIVLPIYREKQGRLKGFGYLIFPDFESMKNATNLNGKDFGGRTIVIDVPAIEIAHRVASRSTEGPFGRRRTTTTTTTTRRQRPEAPQTIADQAENWRGSAGADNVPDIFGRKKQRQPKQAREGEEFSDIEASFQKGRPREERSPKPSFEEQFQRKRESRERREERPHRKDGERPLRKREQEAPATDEQDPLLTAISPQSERRKLVLKERTVAEPIGAKAKSTDIFGEGKPWEETEQLREHLEKLAIETKLQVAVATENKKKKKRKEETPTTPTADKGKNVERAKSDEKEFVSEKRDKNDTEDASPSRTSRWFSETSPSGKSDAFERKGKKGDKRQTKEFNSNKKEATSSASSNKKEVTSSASSNKKEASSSVSSNKKESSSTGNSNANKETKKDENLWTVLGQVEE
jgi:RNA recognition motif-containing protein